MERAININSHSLRGLLFLLMLLCFSRLAVTAQCIPPNEAFRSGESLKYTIHYNWGAIWMAAGEVTFTATAENYKGKDTYHFVGSGGTYPKYDWFYKVRDKYESWADSATLKPVRFIRDSHEGGNSVYNDYVFDHRRKIVYTGTRDKNNKLNLDSVKITACTNDVVTAIYYSRNIDFNKYKPNDTIPLSLVLDNKVYPVYIRYMGKEIYDHKQLGKYNCIKFRPLLIEGTIFKGGEGMTVWVTDDRNKIPLYVETPIVVGTIKVYLSEMKGLRNPLTSKVKQ